MTLYQWNQIRLEKLNEQLSRKVISGKNIMLAQVFLKKGCVVPAHKHDNEQMTYILEGCLKLQLPDGEVTVREGEVLHIPSGIEHSAVALEETLDVDIFSPIREDWLTGKDDYLRKQQK